MRRAFQAPRETFSVYLCPWGPSELRGRLGRKLWFSAYSEPGLTPGSPKSPVAGVLGWPVAARPRGGCPGAKHTVDGGLTPRCNLTGFQNGGPGGRTRVASADPQQALARPGAVGERGLQTRAPGGGLVRRLRGACWGDPASLSLGPGRPSCRLVGLRRWTPSLDVLLLIRKRAPSPLPKMAEVSAEEKVSFRAGVGALVGRCCPCRRC